MGGLLELCCIGRRVVGDVVDHRGNISLGVYQREEGEETVNTEQTDASLSITWKNAVLEVN